MQDDALDELDLRLLNALQISPRTSWTQLGTVLGVDPVTLARRWERLRSERLAWVTAVPLPGFSEALALVDIEARSGTVLSLAETLGRDAEAISIDITSGGRDLVVTVGAPSRQELVGYLLERLGTMESIARIRTSPVSTVLTDASRWRLRALEPGEVRALSESLASTERPRTAGSIDGLVTAELQRDGRASTRAIADRLGVTQRRVSQAVAGLLASGRVTLRTEIVRSLSGWPVSAWYFISAPAAEAAHVSAQLSRIDEIRTVVTVVGKHNVLINAWMRSLDDVTRMEAAIEQNLPSVRIADRSVVMRTTKQAGNLLDAEGRLDGFVLPVPSRR